MNATFSLVPTPSALATSTGSRSDRGSSRNSPPNEPMSDSTPGVNVPRASDLIRRTASLPASMSTPGLPVVSPASSELQLADQRLHQPRARRSVGALPVGAARRSRRTAPPRNPLRACRTPRASSAIAASRSGALSSSVSISGVLRSATVAERERDRRARRIARRDADVEQRRRPRRRARRRRARQGPTAAPRSSSWKPVVLVGELQRLDQIVLVRLAVDAEQADRRGDRRLRRSRRRPLQRGQRLERALVADLAQRQHRIVLQRPVELGDRGDRRRARTAPCSRRAPR